MEKGQLMYTSLDSYWIKDFELATGFIFSKKLREDASCLMS